MKKISLLLFAFMTIMAGYAATGIEINPISGNVTTKGVYTISVTLTGAEVTDTFNIKLDNGHVGGFTDDLMTNVTGGTVDFELNTYVTTGDFQIIVNQVQTDIVVLSDTLDFTITGEDQTYFYVSELGDDANWGESYENAVYSVATALKYAYDNDTIYLDEGEFLQAEGQYVPDEEFFNSTVLGKVSIIGQGPAKSVVKGFSSPQIAQTAHQDADCNRRFVNVSKGGALTVIGVAFENFGNNSDGGVIWSDSSTVVLKFVDIAYCFAKQGTAVTSKNLSILNMQNCNITNNIAEIHSTVSNGNTGGALRLVDPLDAIIDNCNISDNEILGAETKPTSGAAIAATLSSSATHGKDCNVLISNSTISNNTATITGITTSKTYGGGALFTTINTGATDTLNIKIENTTIVGNSAGLGGAFFLFANNGKTVDNSNIDMINCTVVRNTATAPEGSAMAAQTGGVFIHKLVTVNMINNILAENNTADATDNDVNLYIQTVTPAGNGKQPIVKLKNNIVELVDGDLNQYFDLGGNDITAQTSLNLDAELKNNGGFTETIALLENSVAIDAGIAITDSVPTVDQRNAERATTPDLGAFEFGATAPEVVLPEYPVLADTTNQGGNTAIFDQNDSQENLTIYPNPNNGTFRLNMPLSVATVEVIDISGRTVFSTIHSSGSSMAIPDDCNGFYFVKTVGVDGNVAVKRMLVNK